ncbi:unnamed protein product [Cylicostephanus goldi]|uniref:Uncharacterized protein n=1 Tax=Cylicostephanus goldi TaxID=71465 RepID=A0A3P7N1W6_CYLGO|nr:unnamed protein product [Cylicostephanus goldi]
MVTSAKGIQTMCNYAAKLKKSTLADKVAAKGRENVASHEISTPSSSLRHDIDEDPAPRRMSIKRRAAASTVMQQPVGDDRFLGHSVSDLR